MWDSEDNADAAGVALISPFGPVTLIVGWSPRLIGQWRYYTLSDKNGMRSVDFAAGVIYYGGPMTMGVGARYWRTRRGPESATFQGVKRSGQSHGEIRSDSRRPDGHARRRVSEIQ